MYGGNKKPTVVAAPDDDDYEDEDAVEDYDAEDLAYEWPKLTNFQI